jgi:hypothetical protein
MALLMHLGFDNARRLKRTTYYLQYRDIRFKLIQNNPRKWSDVLLTLVPQNDKVLQEQAFVAAGEFLSALSWQNSSPIFVRNLGGFGVRDSSLLRESRCRIFSPPRQAFMTNSGGYDITRLPKVESEEHRIALTLMREALSSNKDFLSFLFYWQVLEVRGGKPVSWINKIFHKQSRVHVSQNELAILEPQGRRLGETLQDDCRHAIAHIRRRAGKRALRFDRSEENRRIAVSTNVIQRLAKLYVKDVLALRDVVFLVRKGGRGFPMYVDRQAGLAKPLAY